jgi:LDH2 family malate/lactate/ureidoglycolate dehydrogenase
LTGGCSPPAPPGTIECNNVLLVVWDPARCAGAPHFIAEADKLIAAVRATPRKAGVDRIQIPGDKSAEMRAKRLKEGIPLAEEVWSQLTRVAEKLGVIIPAGDETTE